MILPLANRARQAHAGALGHSRLRAPLRPRPGGDVAAGDGGGPATRSTSWPSRASASPILAPHQAQRVRPIGEDDVDGRDRRRASIRRCPTAAALPSGRTHRRCSSTTARSRAPSPSRGCWRSGENFAHRLMERLRRRREHDRSSSTSPPTARRYGHHHRYGDMALAYALALHRTRNASRASRTTASFLELYPPTHEVEIVENTVWSCAHGVERWRSDCGCNTGGGPAGTSTGAAPLRGRARLAAGRAARPLTRRRAATFVARPVGGARRLHRRRPRPLAGERSTRFLARARPARADDGERVAAAEAAGDAAPRHAHVHELRLVLRRISGHRDGAGAPVRGAGDAAGEELFGISLESAFLERLEKAPSNMSEPRRRRPHLRAVRQACQLDSAQVGAHYAISSLFETYAERTRIDATTFDRQDFRASTRARTRLAVGRVDVTSPPVQGRPRIWDSPSCTSATTT